MIAYWAGRVWLCGYAGISPRILQINYANRDDLSGSVLAVLGCSVFVCKYVICICLTDLTASGSESCSVGDSKLVALKLLE